MVRACFEIKCAEDPRWCNPGMLYQMTMVGGATLLELTSTSPCPCSSRSPNTVPVLFRSISAVMAEIAKLVEVLFEDNKQSPSDLSQRLRSDSELKVGMENFYSILKSGVEAIGDGKLGLEGWDQSQNQAVASLALAIAYNTRSLSVDHVDPMIVAVVQKSMEFALCYLEKSTTNGDDLSVQILQILLVDGMHKDADSSQLRSLNALVESLPLSAVKNSSIELQDHAKCIFQGGSCSKEEKPVDRLLLTLASEVMHPDNVNPPITGQPFHHDFNMLVSLSQHWAIVHLGCFQRLLLICKEMLELPEVFDEKMAGTNLRKRISFCTRIFKLLGLLTKDIPYVVYDAVLLQAVAFVADVLPILFRPGFEFVSSNVPVECSFESLVVLLLEEFLQLVQVLFPNSNLNQNIHACIIASILGNLDSSLWRYNKSAANPKPPLAYSPRTVDYILKLIGDLKKQTFQALELKNFSARNLGSCSDFENDSPSCQVRSEKIFLLKKYTIEGLLKIIFPSSTQWVDDLMHLVFLLHAEGVKSRPKLERSYSSGTKASCTSEPENVVCHEDEALFGDLFSEGGRSAGSIDGRDQHPIAASSIVNVCNMPIQAATGLLIFLKTCVFSPEWQPSIYEDGYKKLTDSHIDILLSILNCQGCYSEDRSSDMCVTSHEQRKIGHVHELCFELLHNFLSQRVLSDTLEEYLIEKILNVENGVFVYNDQTLALLAHGLIYRDGLTGSQLRTKIYGIYVDFVCGKAKTLCSTCPSLEEFLETMPSVFHIEILLMAFHLSSEDEKTTLAKFIFSSVRSIDAPVAGFNSTQLSCWALLVSRLVLILRHMIFHPRACPSTLLLKLRSRLREVPLSGSRPLGDNNDFPSWSSIGVESFMGAWIKEGPASGCLLSHLVDIAPIPSSVCVGDLASDCLGLTWGEICACFSWILEFWKGKKAARVEELILERYLFMLCWDVPTMSSTWQHLLSFWSGTQTPEISNMEHFFYFSHSILGHSGVIGEHVNLLDLVFGVLQHLHSLDISEDIGDLGWDFLRNGSWLSLVLSLLSAGVQKFCMTDTISLGGPKWPVHSSRDADFFTLAELLISSSFAADRVAVILRILTSLLKRYLRVHQKAFLSSFDNTKCSADRFSPLLLLKHTGFDKCMLDELFEKSGFNCSQVGSIYELLSKLSKTVDKMSPGILYSIFWEFVLHGFPCHLQVPSAIILSCILSIKGIISFLDGLLKVKDAREFIHLDTEVLHQILETVLTIKSDRIFECLHEKCESVYSALSRGLEGPDYCSLFDMKHMEEILRVINATDVSDSGIYECVVTKAIDTMESLRKEPSRGDIFKFFVSMEDVSEPLKDLYGSQRGDLLVLIDSLDNCDSELVNIKVLNFFVDLLSGEMRPDIRQELQKKFLAMDELCLSKWLAKRLLGLLAEASGGVTCGKGGSVSLRESTMNFISCLLPSSSEVQSRELHNHLFEAMLVSLDSAFILFDTNTAKSYFNFIVQFSRGETSMKSLLQHIVMLMEKLAGNDHLLQGLKFLFNFVGTVLSDCGSGKNATEKPSGKALSSCSAGVGPVASRSLGSRKNSDTLVLSANQEGGATTLDCDATSGDEEEDDGTSDGEVGSMDKDEEEDTNCERALASKVCTFTSSGSNFMEQHWYFCYTCDLTVSKGCCSVCAKVCHRGHRVVYSRSSRFFCDCGAGGVRGSSCQCLKPRKFTGSSSAASRGAANFQSFVPFAEDGDQLPDSDSDVDEDVLIDIDNSVRLSIPREVQDGMPQFLEELDIEGRVLELCSSLLPSVSSRRDSNLSRDKKITLGDDKVLCYGADFLQLKKAYKSGSLDLKIKADYSNAKDLKSHLATGSLVKSLLSVSSRGRLAVGEGDKVAIFDVGQLIGQATIAPVTADKTNVKPLSRNVIRFEIVHLVFNPGVENYLAVAGYEDCQILTVSNRGEVTDRLPIELALQGAYIRRVNWVPGSQVQLMVVTNRFVKIYDLSQDNISPMYYVTLPEDTIVDATLVVASQGRVFLIVLSELGCLFRLELSMTGNAGAKQLKEIIQFPGRDVHVKGSSLYFSPSYKLLFLSYQDGTTLISRLNPDATSPTEISAVYEDDQDGKLRPAGMHRWTELLGGSGLFVCFSSVKSNAALIVSMGDHEILAQNMRHTVGSTSSLVGITAYKPLSKDKIHCLVLHDDGSLQIYSHVPVGVDAGASAINDKVKKLGSSILNNKVYAGSNPEFPLDFFEKTVCITADVKLSGDAIRGGDSEGAKQSLASEDGFLESSSPAGFKVLLLFS
ncbi:unnamed protein product [Ilex paraguariensis]|uniref:UBR-type domain-containing protein n=1 Tax=Ilex paraguariensis TaxID=185542 RepID=A0ABC8U745_9AQUA